MIVDATCAPSNIRYPQDTALLNEARACAEKIIDALHTPGEENPRTYRKEAHREYMKFARCKKRSNALVRKAIRKQLGYLSRDLGHINAMRNKGGSLDAMQMARLETIQRIFYSRNTCLTIIPTPWRIGSLVSINLFYARLSGARRVNRSNLEPNWISASATDGRDWKYFPSTPTTKR